MIVHTDESTHHIPGVDLYLPTGAPVLATLYRGWDDVPTITTWLTRLRGQPGIPRDSRCIGPGPDGTVLLVHRTVEHVPPGNYLIYDGQRLFQARPDEFPYYRLAESPSNNGHLVRS